MSSNSKNFLAKLNQHKSNIDRNLEGLIKLLDTAEAKSTKKNFEHFLQILAYFLCRGSLDYFVRIVNDELPPESVSKIHISKITVRNFIQFQSKKNFLSTTVISPFTNFTSHFIYQQISF